MRQFFKFMFASCLGVILAGVVLSIIMFSVFGVIASSFSGPKIEKLSPNTVLKLDLNQVFPERSNNIEMNPFDFKQDGVLGLHETTELIAKAAEDKNIKALYLEITNPGLGNASASQIRQAILDFKKSGKPVIAFSHYYSERNYYLASAADKVYLNPIGSVNFDGFGVILPYFKNMLDKIGVEMQVFYAGQFKSATEPFRSDHMSEQNRIQTKAYLHDLYQVFLRDISTSRNISIDSLNIIADNYLSRNAESALQLGLVDGLMQENQVLDELKKLVGLEGDAKLKTASISKFKSSVSTKSESSSKDKIAIVYAEGEINDGEETAGQINGDQYVKLLRKIREDKNVKAVVLRVNSPGGSVLASDRILRELQLIKDNDIPIVVSMGDVAASGGYYISCAADKIYAEENTITGSIGVFTLVPNIQKLMNDKIGITFDTVRTNTYSTSFNTIYKFNSNERAIVQEGIEEIYALFVGIVANARNMSTESVHEVAQGRVWSGKNAQSIGLVDEIGGLDKALAEAAKLAGIENFKKIEYPKTKDPIEQLLEQIMGKSDDAIIRAQAKKYLGEYHGLYDAMISIRNSQGLQARLPYQILMN
jgi:protease IV